MVAEASQFPGQIHGVPEEDPSEILAPNRPNQPFDKGMRSRSVRNRLDLLDLGDPKVGEPAVEAEQWVMIGAEVSWRGLSSDGVIEHPTYGYAVDVSTFDAKADDAAGEYFHDQQHLMTVQEDRFAAEEVDAPKAILRLSDQGQPGRSGGARVAGTVVLGEDAPHDVLVDLNAKGVRDLQGDAHAAKLRVALLELDDGGDEFREWTLGAGHETPAHRCRDARERGLAVAVVRLALLPGGRASGNRAALAPSWIATVLALQVTTGLSADSSRTAATRTARGERESVVGRGADCQRIAAQARFAVFPADRAQVHAEATAGSPAR